MKVLYLVPFWPHLYTPWLFREIAWMRDRGHGVSVMSLKEWPDGQVNVTNYHLEDVPVLQVRTRYRSDLALAGNVARLGGGGLMTAAPQTLRRSIRAAGLRQGLQDWSSLKRMLAFVRKQGAEVIEAQWATEAAAAALQVHLATGIPYTVTFEGGDLYRTPSPALPQIVASAAALFPVSRFLADLLEHKVTAPFLPPVPACDVDPAKLRIRHHGVPAQNIAAEPAPQREDLQVIVSTGRLDPEKRQQDLIEAAAPLAGQFPGLRVRIIGGGQRQEELAALAAKLGIADRVEITGPQPWPRVIELVRAAHIYVSTSQVEGCSSATLEGASQGLPVVASRTGAHAQVVDEGQNGYLFDVGDVSVLRTRLGQLLGDAALRRRMGGQSLDIMHRRFVFEDLMRRVEEMLCAVTQRRPLPA